MPVLPPLRTQVLHLGGCAAMGGSPMRPWELPPTVLALTALLDLQLPGLEAPGDASGPASEAYTHVGLFFDSPLEEFVARARGALQ